MKFAWFGEAELVALWKTMYFYWVNKTSYGAVERLFNALESSTTTSTEALMSLCRLIIDMPHKSDHLLPAFARFLSATRLDLNPRCALVLRNTLVTIRTERLED